MSTQVQRRRGTTGQHAAFTGALGETTFDTDLNRPVVHDGLLPGGFPSAMLHLSQLFPLSQTLAADENFFGNTTDPDNAIVFQNPVGVGTNTLDFRTNGTLDANFIRKYNTTPFQIESASSGSLDFVIDSRDVATGTSIRFFTNGIRGSGTQTLLAEFEDNGMVNFTGALSMGTNLINDVVNPVAAQDAATKNYVDGLIAAGAPPFTDSTALVKGSGDATKLMRFEVDGFTAATTRVLTPPDANIIIAGTNFDNAWADGVTQRFNPSGVTAGINVGANAIDPSFLVNGDIWYQSTANELRARINGVTVAFGAAGASPPFTDSNALVAGSGDPTKLMRFEIDGFTAGATRVLTPPDADITLAGINIAQEFGPSQEFLGGLTWGASTSQMASDGSLAIDLATGLFTVDVTAQAIGFFAAVPTIQQDVSQLTNNITPGGTADQLDDFSNDSGTATIGVDLMDSATVPDKATLDGILDIIRNDAYQLGQKVNQIITLLEAYGLSTP